MARIEHTSRLHRKSTREKMKSDVDNLVEEGVLVKIGERVQAEHDKDRHAWTVPDATLIIYTAPPSPVKDTDKNMLMLASPMLQHAELYERQARYAGALEFFEIAGEDHAGRRIYTEKTTIETSIVVETNAALDPDAAPVVETETIANIWSEPIMKKTHVRIYPSPNRARLGFRFDSEDLPYHDYPKEFDRLRKEEKRRRAKKIQFPS